MTIKYRIIKKDIVCDGQDKSVALETLQMFQTTYPENNYEIEEYNWRPDGHRLGRDPDLITK